MKLTLRKANAVQAAINEVIKGLDLSTSVTLNEFEEVTDQIQVMRDRFLKAAETREQLVTSLYEIRSKVAQANAASGINDMLSVVAFLEKQISYNNTLASKGAQTSLRVLSGHVKKSTDATGDAYGYNRREIVTSIFTEEEIEKFRKNAADNKRQKQKLQDRLLELNIQTEIELPEVTAKFLTETGIL
jgi:hypothetical protein